MDVVGVWVPRVVRRRCGGGEGKAVGIGMETRDGMSGLRFETPERTTFVGCGCLGWGSGCSDSDVGESMLRFGRCCGCGACAC